MPNGADQIYGIIEDETEFAQEFEARGNYKAAKKTWEHVLELWQQVLDHHDATTGCGQESIRKIAEIRMRLVRLAKRASDA